MLLEDTAVLAPLGLGSVIVRCWSSHCPLCTEQAKAGGPSQLQAARMQLQQVAKHRNCYESPISWNQVDRSQAHMFKAHAQRCNDKLLRGLSNISRNPGRQSVTQYQIFSSYQPSKDPERPMAALQ